MNSTIHITLRTNCIRKDLSQSVCLRLTINRKSIYYSLGVSAKTEDFDIKKQLIKKSAFDSYNKNLVIESSKQKAKKIIFDYKLNEKQLTFSEFKNLFRPAPESKSTSFYDFAEKEAIRRVELSAGSKKRYKSSFKKLKEFRSELNLNEVDYNFLHSYVFFLKGKGNKHNTICNDVKSIKVLFNEAQRQKLIDENKRLIYPMGWEETEEIHLEGNEIKRINNLLLKDNLSDTMRNIITYFLFACFTGLRFGDIVNLRYSNVNENFDSLSLVDQKTGKNHNAHLIEPAKKIVEKLIVKENSKINPKVFKTYSNQKTNELLKVVAEMAEINKKLSFHKARHTFGTIAISNGVPMETVSHQLNHSSIKMTQKYAHLTDAKRKNDFKGLDNLL